MVGSGDRDRVHLFVLEEPPHVGIALWGLVLSLPNQRLTPLERRLIDIAEGADPAERDARVSGDVIPAATAEADDGHLNSIVGSKDWTGLCGDGYRGGMEEISASGHKLVRP